MIKQLGIVRLRSLTVNSPLARLATRQTKALGIDTLCSAALEQKTPWLRRENLETQQHTPTFTHFRALKFPMCAAELRGS